MAKTRKTTKKKTTRKEHLKVDESEIKSLLLSKRDELIDKDGLDESLDELLLKTALVNPSQHPHIVGVRVAYVKKFPLDFYRHIFKLYGWPVVSDQCLRKRPGIIAKITANFEQEKWGWRKAV